MPIITFTSDFGLRDNYVASVKGRIYSRKPEVVIVDISHDIEKHNTQSAAHVLSSAFKYFPEKTIHIIGVSSEIIKGGGYVVVEHQNHFFISADNGIFSLMFEETPSKIIELKSDIINRSFPVLDVFVDAAVSIANGADMMSLGQPKEKLLQYLPFKSSSNGNIIRGAVVYIDSYNNAITNIDKTLFDRVGKGQPFVIEFARGYQIESISNDYSDVPPGEVLALFNSSGYLELSMRHGNICGLLKLELNASITIEFI
jgi:S-adenosyl-L-methionine hydrolase (adenosine-forming)